MNRERFSGIFNATDWPVTLIGAGGIGAITAVTLAKMGVPQLTIFDDDQVSDVNIPTQFFRTFDIESLKTKALTDMLITFSDEIHVDAWDTRVGADTPTDWITNPIIISAVDSITARQEIWGAVKRTKFMWYVDARMGAESFLAYIVNGTGRDWYDKALGAQDESLVEDLPCTQKATTYTAMIAAGHLGSIVRDIVTDRQLPKIISHDILNRTLTLI